MEAASLLRSLIHLLQIHRRAIYFHAWALWQSRGRKKLIFGQLNDLVARIHYVTTSADARPLAILCGSGLTVPSVPSVNKIINSIRASLQPAEQLDLDVRLRGFESAAEKYQEAFNFLSLRRPPAHRDRVIALSTLAAYQGSSDERAHTAPSDLATFESNIDGWSLPPGVESMGRLWAGLPRELRGPIITTNFDPLCEVAIRKAGRSATPLIVNDDSTFLRTTSVIDDPVVLHIHGYWRESNTLSMNDQLTVDRPALAAGIRELLRKYTFLVVGYAGWADVVTQQIAQLIREQRASELDILWCAFEQGADFEDSRKSNNLFEELTKAAGNVSFYESIDCNKLFPALENELIDVTQPPAGQRMGDGRGTLLGWSSIIEQSTSVPSNAIESAVSFFDGRLPSWHDAENPFVPKRDIVASVSNYLYTALRKKLPSLTTIIGPAGEGKSTALMQIVLQIRRSSPEVQVLYQQDSHYGGIQEILALPDTRPYLLVIDDAYGYLDRVKGLVDRLNQEGRGNIHLLVASRDSDWRINGGASFVWNRYVAYRSFVVKGMSRPDAAAIVQSWEDIGPAALGELAKLQNTEQRISQLVLAASDPRFRSEGAFLGALLVTRLGSGLESHIQDMLDRAGNHAVTSEGATLADVLAIIALPHASGVYELNFGVLSECLGISLAQLHADVLPGLGEEAALSVSDQRITIRHRLIAEIICSSATYAGVDMADVTRRVVQSAIRVARRSAFSKEYRKLAYLSGHIHDPELAVVAAEAAVEVEPNRLTYRTSLAAAIRRAGDPLAASKVGEDSLRMMRTADDSSSARALFTEWGVSEGLLGNWARNATLAAVALQDTELLGKLETAKIASALSCLLLAFRRLVETSEQSTYVKALAAIVMISSPHMAREKQHWLNEAEELVTDRGFSMPSSVTDCKRDLAEGCRLARISVEHPLPPQMPPMEFRFERLIEISDERWLYREPSSSLTRHGNI